MVIIKIMYRRYVLTQCIIVGANKNKDTTSLTATSIILRDVPVYVQMQVTSLNESQKHCVNILVWCHPTDTRCLCKFHMYFFSIAGSVGQTHYPQHRRDNAEPQVDGTFWGRVRPGAIHHSAIQRLRRSEDVDHGLSRPESTLLNDCIQLERGEREKNKGSRTWRWDYTGNGESVTERFVG